MKNKGENKSKRQLDIFKMNEAIICLILNVSNELKIRCEIDKDYDYVTQHSRTSKKRWLVNYLHFGTKAKELLRNKRR